MFRTALLSALLATAAYFSSAWLTHDFQVWTAEGARRLEVALQPIPAPPVQMDGPGVATQPLSQFLADGKTVTVLDFVYTSCQTVCLALGSVYQQMQAQLQAADPGGVAAQRVRLLSISFDGAHDTPAILQTYAASLSAEAPHWRFVRVPSAAENQRLLNAFQVVVVPNEWGDFEHNAALLVVDQRGRLVRIFDYTEQQLALDYARYLAGGAVP